MKKLFRFLLFSAPAVLLVVSCSKEYSFEKASGTLKDGSGNCYAVGVFGSYYDNINPVADSNYILVLVNVLKTGNYIFKTDLQNGFMFSDSGLLTSNGLQTLKLKMSGKPINDTLTNFTLVFDTSVCTFSINVRDSVPVVTEFDDMKPNTWEFTDSTHGSYHKGGIIGNPPSTSSLGHYVLNGAASLKVPYDTFLLFEIAFPEPKPVPGIYYTNGENYFSYFKETLNLPTYYEANEFNGNLKIEVVAYDSITRFIKAKFSGTAIDINKQQVYITKGRFVAKNY